VQPLSLDVARAVQIAAETQEAVGAGRHLLLGLLGSINNLNDRGKK